MGPDERRGFARLVPSEVVAAPLVEPTADLVGGPARQVERFEGGSPGLGVGPREEQEGLDDPPEPLRLVPDPSQRPSVFLDRSVASKGDVDLADQGRQGGSELMRGVAREPRLAFEGLVPAVEQSVEGDGQVFELVVRPDVRELTPRLLRAQLARGRGHPGERRQRPSTEPATDNRRRSPEGRRERGQHQAEGLEGPLDRVESEGCPQDERAMKIGMLPVRRLGMIGDQPAFDDPQGMVAMVDLTGTGFSQAHRRAQVLRAGDLGPTLVQDDPAHLVDAEVLPGKGAALVGLPVEPSVLVLDQGRHRGEGRLQALVRPIGADTPTP